MDEDQTEDFFLSITEYDDSREKELHVSMQNLGFYVDNYDRLVVTCELSRLRIIKDTWPSLNIVAFNHNNKIRESRRIGSFNPSDKISNKFSECTFCDTKPQNIGKLKVFWKDNIV